MYDLEEEKLVEEIKNRGSQRVLIQLPEGLKREGFRLSKLVENRTTADVFISADPCYGACDVALDEANSLGADLLIHYGHTPFINQTGIPIIYLYAPQRDSVMEVVKKAVPILSDMKRIGLATTIQHVHELENAKKILEETGKTVLIGKKVGMTQLEGQILGCDYSTAKNVANIVDGFLFIGGGNFHPLGLAMETGKKVIVADPYKNEVRDIVELTRITYRQRWMAIEKARRAKRFGVIVGLKPGQKKIDIALKIRQRLKKNGKETVLLAAKELSPLNMLNFQDVEAFVVTACPRLAIDDSKGFSKPILTERELRIMLGDEPWEEYVKE
jgi:2-(3-amino-3-carboxypropyl)histidine synthase